MSQLVDKEALAELKDFIQARFPEIVETYLRNADVYVSKIRNGFKEEDFKGVADAAHPLKSSSGNLGLVGLCELCQSIEETALGVIAGDKTADTLSPMVEQIQDVYDQSAAFLKAELE